MTNEDALERLMQRQRPTVPPRSDELVPGMAAGGKSEGTSGQVDVSASGQVDVNTDGRQDETVDLPELVRTTARIEIEIDQALRTLCIGNRHRFTKEVWFEAAYLYLKEQPEAMAAVIELAKQRYQRRKRAAEFKKLETMQKRLRGEG
jgi:hypothetical protein